MIYTITLNPAIDHIIQVQGELTRGRNNKVNKSILDIGGKATHVSVVLSTLAMPNISTGFIGELKKEILYRLLREQKVNPQFYVLPDKTVRENYIVMDESNKGSFMITHEGPEVSNEQIREFVADLESKLKKDDIVVIAGNPSKKMSKSDFLYILKKIKSTGAKIVVDVSGEYLKVALEIEPTLIKPNQYEFSECIGGEPIESVEDCIRAYKQFNRKNIEYLVVSLGKQGSVLFHKNNVYIAESPNVETVNDTGCGDAFVGGLVYGFANNHSIERTLKFATAISASKAMQLTSSGVEVEQAKKLRQAVSIKKLPTSL